MTINPLELQRYLAGVDYPADRESLLRAAEINGASDEVLASLAALGDERFDAPTDVSAAVGNQS